MREPCPDTGVSKNKSPGAPTISPEEQHLKCDEWFINFLSVGAIILALYQWWTPLLSKANEACFLA